MKARAHQCVPSAVISVMQKDCRDQCNPWFLTIGRIAAFTVGKEEKNIWIGLYVWVASNYVHFNVTQILCGGAHSEDEKSLDSVSFYVIIGLRLAYFKSLVKVLTDPNLEA